MSLTKDLAELLNKHSVENASGTPDYILAHFLLGTLDVFQETIEQRAKWRGETVELPTLDKKKVPLVVYTDGRRNEIGEAEIEMWPGEVRVEVTIDGVGDISGVVPIVNDASLDTRNRIY